MSSRDPFAREALRWIPKILTLQDRNRHSPTYGCFDRNYWQYKIIDFPSGMSQEFVYPLALAWAAELEGNAFYRQDALREMLTSPMDLLLVIGGYNSSNTSHLAEMGEAKLPTYFIRNASRLESRERIVHFDQHVHREVTTEGWLPGRPLTAGLTAGASCPNNLIEETILRLD